MHTKLIQELPPIEESSGLLRSAARYLIGLAVSIVSAIGVALWKLVEWLFPWVEQWLGGAVGALV